MKKIFLMLLTISFSWTALADEGMWMLPYLQKLNSKAMQDAGCKLSASDIYKANGSSLKDAIVVFGGGCTGEIVSPEGLLFTNHHCGYGSIQALSSVENDYLKNGFWAMSQQEEIPAPGLEVRFIRQIIDVTEDLLGKEPTQLAGEERNALLRDKIKPLQEKLKAKYPNMELNISSFFGGNQYIAFVTEVYKDVRLVGTPPTSIGKFGGDTDNWMWPRHTGDFSIFRVYAGADNKPAAYATTNVPYEAKKYLKASLDGYQEGDFAMIMGFPGSTQRYMTSYEIDQMLEVLNPQRIFIRGERQDILQKDMAASDKVRIQYAAKYAQSSNYWKNSIGMSRGLTKLNVKAKKVAQEQAFQQWADAPKTQAKYGTNYAQALGMIRDAVAANMELEGTSQYMNEAFIRAVELLSPARVLTNLPDTLTTAQREALQAEIKHFYKDFDASTDRKVAKRMFQIVKQHVRDLPTIFADVIDVQFGGDTDAYVDYLYDHSAFASENGAQALLANYSKEKAKNDPAVQLSLSVNKKIRALNKSLREGRFKLKDGQRLYIAGLQKMQPNKKWAADANFTLRLTYGNVLPYDPVDGVTYHHYTTLKGIIDKEDPKNPVEFTVPAKLKELYATANYGRYANEKGELPVAFLVNCDITGGNSGSPVLDANGRWIGLAFDGNWEAMSGDIAFEPDLQRTIAVDIRYVFFVIDQFAGADWILREMTIEKK
ncbi:MAG: S46 family peptidase [Alistipes sp.]